MIFFFSLGRSPARGRACIQVCVRGGGPDAESHGRRAVQPPPGTSVEENGTRGRGKRTSVDPEAALGYRNETRPGGRRGEAEFRGRGGKEERGEWPPRGRRGLSGRGRGLGGSVQPSSMTNGRVARGQEVSRREEKAEAAARLRDRGYAYRSSSRRPLSAAVERKVLPGSPHPSSPAGSLARGSWLLPRIFVSVFFRLERRAAPPLLRAPQSSLSDTPSLDLA